MLCPTPYQWSLNILVGGERGNITPTTDFELVSNVCGYDQYNDTSSYDRVHSDFVRTYVAVAYP